MTGLDERSQGAAMVLAAVLVEAGRFSGMRGGLIPGGGNVDLEPLPWQGK